MKYVVLIAICLLLAPASASAITSLDSEFSVPCPDGSLGRLFCAITNAINDYCEEEFGEPCLL